MNSNSELLQSTGVDISVKSADLSEKLDEAFTAEEQQLRARADAQDATQASQQATESVYRAASNAVDLIVGALGKSDALSRRLRGIRDDIANQELRGKRSETADV